MLHVAHAAAGSKTVTEGQMRRRNEAAAAVQKLPLHLVLEPRAMSRMGCDMDCCIMCSMVSGCKGELSMEAICLCYA